MICICVLEPRDSGAARTLVGNCYTVFFVLRGYNSQLHNRHQNRNNENVSDRSSKNRHGPFNNRLMGYVNTGRSMETSLAWKLAPWRENCSTATITPCTENVCRRRDATCVSSA